VEVDANGSRLWFDVEGPALVPNGASMRERPTVLLLHGGPGSFDHSYLKPDFGRLAEVAQVVYLDLLGHGRSEHGDAAAWTFESCADSVRDFCEAVALEQPVVYGHSLGGMVAMLVAARHPDMPGVLVLQSSPARFDVGRLVSETGGERAAVSEVAGLRVITLDSLVPGSVQGLVSDVQLEWLGAVLTQPAPAGSIVVSTTHR